MSVSLASVVVPAHQEASTIARCLRALSSGPPVHVVVAANGCTDATAQIAATHGVVVLDLPDPGKSRALNAADEVAKGFPRLYVDADVVLLPGAVEALVRTLSSDGALLATPRRALDLDGVSLLVRAYYRTAQALQQVRGDLLGCGVYAVNQAGRTRWQQFPAAIADDYFVHSLFGPQERVLVPAAVSVVRPPRNLRALVAVRTRVQAGNMTHRLDRPAMRRGQPSWRRLWTDPLAVLCMPVYVTVAVSSKLMARRRVRRRDHAWSQDTSQR